MIRFICGNKKNLSNIKMSQNIIARILLLFMSYLGASIVKKSHFLGWNLLYVFRKRHTPNFIDFQYEFFTLVERSEK